MGMSDAEISNIVSWHDKSVLCRLLGQKYALVAAGNHWIKPIISVEGLGFHAKRLVLEDSCIIQPEAVGEYLNVDACSENGTGLPTLQAWTARRRGVFFHWFERTQPYLTNHQLWCVETLLDTVPAGTWVNLEFIGDTVIEAHARPSVELWVPERYVIPIWRKPGDEANDLPDDMAMVVLDKQESLVCGLERVALLQTNEDPEPIHAKYCYCSLTKGEAVGTL